MPTTTRKMAKEQEEKAYFCRERMVAWFVLFGIEAPATLALIGFLASGPMKAQEMPALEIDRAAWVLKRGFLAIVPTWAYFWGAARAFQPDVRAEDPFSGTENKVWKKFQKVLTNNVEQCSMFIPAITSAAMLASSQKEWPLIPALFFTFVLGRWLFGAGYFLPTLPANLFAGWGTLEAWGRSPGMNMTLYPTTIAIAFSFYKWQGGSGFPGTN